MWISSRVVDWFTGLQKAADVNAEVAKAAIQDLREELVATRTERDVLRQELTASKLSADWLRLRFNQLELENKMLMQKAYNIILPVPEIHRTQQAGPMGHANSFNPFENPEALFNDMGDELARKLGMPTYDDHK